MNQYTEEQIRAAMVQWYNVAVEDDPEDNDSFRNYSVEYIADYFLDILRSNVKG